MKLSVLIVDDDEVMRDTLSDVLKKKGYEVSVASSGNEALSAIRKNIVDLVVLDMRLPDLDGIEVLKRVKEFDTEILVIMMTAYSDVQTAVSAMKSGAYHYINKPFELEELKLLIERDWRPRASSTRFVGSGGNRRKITKTSTSMGRVPRSRT